jgi:hypothetical protein
MRKISPLLEPIHHREKEATCGLDEARGSPEEPHAIGRVRVKEGTAVHSPRHPQLLEGKLNKIPVSLRYRRSKPCRVW